MISNFENYYVWDVFQGRYKNNSAFLTNFYR